MRQRAFHLVAFAVSDSDNPPLTMLSRTALVVLKPTRPPAMRFARRLAVCVLTVLLMSVQGALLWDQSDQANRELGQAAATAGATLP